jgi:hypothetical protein
MPPKAHPTEEDCLKLKANPNVNPITNRKIDPTKPNGVYAKLFKECSGIVKMDADAIEVPVTVVGNVFDEVADADAQDAQDEKGAQDGPVPVKSVKKKLLKKKLDKKFGKNTGSKISKVLSKLHIWSKAVNNGVRTDHVKAAVAKKCTDLVEKNSNDIPEAHYAYIKHIAIVDPPTANSASPVVHASTSAVKYLVSQQNYPALAFNLGIFNESDTYDQFNDKLKHMYTKNDSWFTDSKNYMLSLSKKEIATVLGYTNIGDRLVNTYMRGDFSVTAFRQTFGAGGKINIDINETDNLVGFNTFPLKYSSVDVVGSASNAEIEAFVSSNCDKDRVYLVNTLHNIRDSLRTKNASAVEIQQRLFKIGWCLSMHFWTLVLKDFIHTLDKVIQHAPVLTSNLTVYRGTKTNLFTGKKNKSKRFTGKPGDMYVNTGYVSTSLDYTRAEFFAGKGYLQRIFLPKGSRALPILGISLYPTELEILLPRDCTYLVRTLQNSKGILNMNETCEPKNKPTVYDIVLV